MERIATGIIGLDSMLNGGFLPSSANLVEGAPGTGKSTLGMQFIVHGITVQEQPGIILSFESFPRQYHQDARSFGWDLPAMESANKLRVLMSSPEVLRQDVRQVNGLLERHAQEIGARRVLVDSLSHFERISRDPIEMRQAVYEFINALKRMGMTLVLTRETPALMGDMPDIEENLAFVVDSYILMRYVEIESAMQRALLVLKLRGSDHAKDIRQYTIGTRGFDVLEKFSGQDGLLSGSPTPTPRQAFGQAFGRPKTGH